MKKWLLVTAWIAFCLGVMVWAITSSWAADIKAPLNANQWVVEYSPGVNDVTNIAGGIQYQFPGNGAGMCPAPDTKPPRYNVSNCHHVDYVEWTGAHNITTNSAVTMTFRLPGAASAVFDYRTQFENCQNLAACGGARIRLIFRRGDTLGPEDRWWARNCWFEPGWVATPPEAFPPCIVDHGNGSYTMTVSLAPTEWSGVQGQMATTDLTNFNTAKRLMSRSGVANGGGYFDSHGIFTSAGGPAFFQITNFEFLP